MLHPSSVCSFQNTFLSPRLVFCLNYVLCLHKARRNEEEEEKYYGEIGKSISLVFLYIFELKGKRFSSPYICVCVCVFVCSSCLQLEHSTPWHYSWHSRRIGHKTLNAYVCVCLLCQCECIFFPLFRLCSVYDTRLDSLYIPSFFSSSSLLLSLFFSNQNSLQNSRHTLNGTEEKRKKKKK